MAARISRSSIDWSSFAKLVSKHEKADFNAFKARSDSYLMRVLSYPENPVEVDWSYYKSKIANKDVVDKLQAAYKSIQVPYPKDTRTESINEQEKEAQRDYVKLTEIANENIRQAQELGHKFRVMIPYHDMTCEDYYLTFPEWVPSRKDPSIPDHPEREPGLTPEERAERAKPDGPPYSIP